MRQVSDLFLVNMAQVCAALIGLFLVGVLFFVETGFGRLGAGRDVVEPYFRASTRIVLVLFAIPLCLSLTLVVLEPVWSVLLFAVLSLLLVVANVDTARRIRAVRKASGSSALLANEVLGTVGVAALVLVPWLLGGLDPSREDLVWSILLSFVIGFSSIVVLVLSIFDFGRSETTMDPPAAAASSRDRNGELRSGPTTIEIRTDWRQADDEPQGRNA